MADSNYEKLLRLIHLKALERACDGDVDKVILWWEAIHADEYFSGMLERARVLRERRKVKRQMRRTHLERLVTSIALKRLADKVVP